jgi:hypothetical protein
MSLLEHEGKGSEGKVSSLFLPRSSSLAYTFDPSSTPSASLSLPLPSDPTSSTPSRSGTPLDRKLKGKSLISMSGRSKSSALSLFETILRKAKVSKATTCLQPNASC